MKKRTRVLAVWATALRAELWSNSVTRAAAIRLLTRPTTPPQSPVHTRLSTFERYTRKVQVNVSIMIRPVRKSSKVKNKIKSDLSFRVVLE